MTRSPRFELIAFDWDGTLSDSTALIVKAIQGACRDVNVPVPSDSQAAYVIGLGLQDALMHVAPTLTVERYPDMAKSYRRHYMARQNDLSLFDGVLPMLSTLKQRGHKLAVATGKSRSGLDEALMHADLAGRFDATRTADETASKPNPMMLQQLMDRFAVQAGQTLMIGDTTHDLEMARRAGVPSVAVSFGAHEPAAFAEYEPLFVAHRMDELAAWLMDHA
jgi:phosphoglycolate phosphatase